MVPIGQWTKRWAEHSNIHVEYHPETTSTNDIAKDRAYDSAEPLLIVTDFQTHGRGRGQNNWETQKSEGGALLSSWSFSIEAAAQPIMSPLIGLALFKAAKSTWPSLHWGLKAPNDLYIGANKVAGLLIETITSAAAHRIIVGLGFNVTSHPDLSAATDLQSALSRSVSEEEWFQFLNAFLVELIEALGYVGHDALLPGVRQDLLLALNARTNLEEPILNVLPDGSIKTQTRTIHWYDL